VVFLQGCAFRNGEESGSVRRVVGRNPVADQPIGKGPKDGEKSGQATQKNDAAIAPGHQATNNPEIDSFGGVNVFGADDPVGSRLTRTEARNLLTAFNVKPPELNQDLWPWSHGPAERVDIIYGIAIS